MPTMQRTYSTRWKLPTCTACNFHLGGTKEPAVKRPKISCHSAVVVVSKDKMTIYSVKTSTRDDRCFVLKERRAFFCSHKDCLNVRATFVSSGRANDFSCKHSGQWREAAPAQESFQLTSGYIERSNGAISAKEILKRLLGSDNSVLLL